MFLNPFHLPPHALIAYTLSVTVQFSVAVNTVLRKLLAENEFNAWQAHKAFFYHSSVLMFLFTYLVLYLFRGWKGGEVLVFFFKLFVPMIRYMI